MSPDPFDDLAAWLATQLTSGGTDANAPPENDLKGELQRLYEIRSDANVLIATGSNSESNTLGGLRLLSVDASLPADVPPPTSDAADVEFWTRYFGSISYHSSDLLLSFVVIFAGCIGAIIAAMRKENVFTLKELGLGLSAGFITFLVIRSGKSVFLLNPGGATFVLNPTRALSSD